MTNLLSADPLDQIQVGLGLASKVEALEQVLHHGAHLSKLAS